MSFESSSEIRGGIRLTAYCESPVAVFDCHASSQDLVRLPARPGRFVFTTRVGLNPTAGALLAAHSVLAVCPGCGYRAGWIQSHAIAMSALPPKADMCSAPPHVCYGPKADIAPWRYELVTDPNRRFGINLVFLNFL